jgi:hypothetical protein
MKYQLKVKEPLKRNLQMGSSVEEWQQCWEINKAIF